MVEQQTCPHCGAGLGFYYCGSPAEKCVDASWYACGTPTDCDFRHADCHKRQLAAKDAEIAEKDWEIKRLNTKIEMMKRFGISGSEPENTCQG
jgi:hypothetical protein